MRGSVGHIPHNYFDFKTWTLLPYIYHYHFYTKKKLKTRLTFSSLVTSKIDQLQYSFLEKPVKLKQLPAFAAHYQLIIKWINCPSGLLRNKDGNAAELSASVEVENDHIS